jgi:hypothetical protein
MKKFLEQKVFDLPVNILIFTTSEITTSPSGLYQKIFAVRNYTIFTILLDVTSDKCFCFLKWPIFNKKKHFIVFFGLWELFYQLILSFGSCKGKDVAKISTNKLSTLVFDFTFISLYVSPLRQGPLQVILHFELQKDQYCLCSL